MPTRSLRNSKPNPKPNNPPSAPVGTRSPATVSDPGTARHVRGLLSRAVSASRQPELRPCSDTPVPARPPPCTRDLRRSEQRSATPSPTGTVAPVHRAIKSLDAQANRLSITVDTAQKAAGAVETTLRCNVRSPFPPYRVRGYAWSCVKLPATIRGRPYESARALARDGPDRYARPSVFDRTEPACTHAISRLVSTTIESVSCHLIVPVSGIDDRSPTLVPNFRLSAHRSQRGVEGTPRDAAGDRSSRRLRSTRSNHRNTPGSTEPTARPRVSSTLCC